MQFLTKLKLWGAAFFAFFITLLSAKYYRGKSKRLERQLKAEKHVLHNQQAQLKSIKRKQQEHLKELRDAEKNDQFLDYFDDN